MKVKNLCLMAGATAAFAISGSALAGDSGIVFNYESSSGALGLAYDGSIDGNLATITIYVTGVPADFGTVGLLNTANTPFLMYTGDGSAFYNSDGFGSSQAFAATAAAGHPEEQDSGFLGQGFTGFGSAWGAPSNDMTSWATSGANIAAYGGQPGFWISLSPTGEPAPGGNIAILRATWDVTDQGNTANGAFNFAVASPLAGDPSDEFYFTWTAAVPAPGALALLGLAGLVGARRRRA